MDVQLSQELTAQASQVNSATAVSDSDTISSDFETFLKMLTAQLENQDPLNPVESQDFAVQLATFSSVEQQVKTNDLLESLGSSVSNSNLSELGSWIGMEARITGAVPFNGSPLDISYETLTDADSAILIVRTEDGTEIARDPVEIGSQELQWAGVAEAGSPLRNGNYNFEIQSLRDGEIISVEPVYHFSKITEARVGKDGTDLVLESGATISSELVTGVRAPS